MSDKPAIEVFPVGTPVRSYDFAHCKDCYIEGVVDGYGGDVFPSDVHYRIAVTRRVWEGRELPADKTEKIVYPPMRGMFSTQLVFKL